MIMLLRRLTIWFWHLLKWVILGKSLEDVEEEILPSVEAVERILCYRFKDRKLVVEALTHGSYYYPDRSGLTYERLEYMGDAVLSCVMAKQLFLAYPELGPGPLTQLRAANVDTEKLARVALKHELHRYIRHKVVFLSTQIEDFEEAIVEYPMHSNGLVEIPKILADIVESLLGAVFVDTGYSLDKVWEVFKGLLEPLITPETLRKHSVTELIEFCQKNGLHATFVNDKWECSTIVEALVNNYVVGIGKYKRKDIAQNRAARDAFEKLVAACKETNHLEAILALIAMK